MKERILVIRFSSLGDVVLATAIPAGLPPDRFETDFLVKAEYAPILERNPGIRKIHRYSGGNVLSLGLALRGERYDRVIDLHASVRSRIVSAFFPGRVLRANQRRRERERIVRRKDRSIDLSRVEDYRAVLGSILGSVPETLPRIHLGAEEIARAGDAIEEAFPGSNGPIVALAPGAKWATKKWGADRSARLAYRLAEAIGARVLAIGGSADLGELEFFRKSLSSASRARVLSGTLRESAALLSRAAVLVTNDSGALHLGAAVGTRVVAIFGPTVPELGFRPVGGGHVVVGDPLECRPCTLHGNRACPLGHHECMRRIDPQSLAETVRSLIGLHGERTAPGGSQLRTAPAVRGGESGE